jgi:hypothetical protein
MLTTHEPDNTMADAILGSFVGSGNSLDYQIGEQDSARESDESWLTVGRDTSVDSVGQLQPRKEVEHTQRTKKEGI